MEILVAILAIIAVLAVIINVLVDEFAFRLFGVDVGANFNFICLAIFVISGFLACGVVVLF